MFTKLKLGAALLVGITMASGAYAQPLGVGAGVQGSNNFANGSGIGKVLIEQGGMNARVQSYGGAGAFLPLINQGEVDIAPATQPDAEEAHDGTGTFEGRAQKNLRLIAVISVTPVSFMVKADSPIKTIADLKGKTVTYGFTSQSQVLTNVDGLLASAGLTPDDIKKVMVPSVGRSVDALIDGSAEVSFFAVRGGKAREADASLKGIRWLSVSDDPAAIARMKAVLPSAYRYVVDPEPGLPGVPESIGTMGLNQTLVAGAHVSDDVVYNITKTLYENVDAVRAASRGLNVFDPAVMAMQGSSIAFHPGAIKYYKEVGAWKE